MKIHKMIYLKIVKAKRTILSAKILLAVDIARIGWSFKKWSNGGRIIATVSAVYNPVKLFRFITDSALIVGKKRT